MKLTTKRKEQISSVLIICLENIGKHQHDNVESEHQRGKRDPGYALQDQPDSGRATGNKVSRKKKDSG